MLSELASDRAIDPAYDWLCRQRRDWPDRADVWDLRFHWDREKPRLKEALRTGRYRFSPLERVTNRNGESISVWSARDALVIKALAIVLGQYLPVSTRCTHIKGHGGLKGAVRAVRDALPQARFVFRTDVKSYYECIDQTRLLDQLAPHVKDRCVLNLVWQVMRRTVTWGGLYRDCERGISRGCPLSPLLGAFVLHDLDSAMEQRGVFYVRFMDDILVLSPTRWKLRGGIKVVNAMLASLKLDKHPDKTWVGRVDRGFDFLGYHFSTKGVTVAQGTLLTHL